MGLLFYYLFHYLHPLLSVTPPPPFLPGLKVNINQRQHLCCVLLFILPSYGAAVAGAAALSEEALPADACGLFAVVLVVALCDVAAANSCGPQARRNSTEALQGALKKRPAVGTILGLVPRGFYCFFFFFFCNPPTPRALYSLACVATDQVGDAIGGPFRTQSGRSAFFLLSSVRDDAGRFHILAPQRGCRRSTLRRTNEK